MKKKKLLLTIIILIFVFIGLYLWEMQTDEVQLKPSSFNQLPGWQNTNTIKSLHAFNHSCKTFLKQKSDTPIGSAYIPMTAKDWYAPCQAALKIDPNSVTQTKAFFEKWFKPVQFVSHRPIKGLFTGYYVPLLHGSLTKTADYNIPLYQTPSNLVTVNLEAFDPTLNNRRLVGRVEGNRLVPFYSREEINHGAIAKSTPVIVWLNSHIDRLFLEIQGSGIIALPDGSHIVVGYASQNGAPYTAIAKVLIEKGILTRDNASMQGIRQYLEAHPEQIEPVINQNKSFVFFEKQVEKTVVGVQNIELTPGYSLAVDRKWIPIGLPIWLDTTRPTSNTNETKPLQRLMIAQDTGGAIRGMVRGDVFWGAGEKATEIAGKMKNPGYYWLLLPKAIHLPQ